MALRIPLLTLHSGAAGTEPNSREFLNHAAKVRPDFVEVDVRLTSDGTVVLHHDPYIQSNNRKLFIQDHSIRELLKVKPGLLTLGDTMDFCLQKGLRLNLDLKAPESLEAIFRECKSRDFHREFIFSGCDQPHVEIIKKKNRGYRVLLSVQDADLLNPEKSPMDYYQKILNLAEKMDCIGININHERCTPEMIELADAVSIPAAVWTVNTEEDIQRCFDMGVGSITTDRADYFRKVQETKARKSVQLQTGLPQYN